MKSFKIKDLMIQVQPECVAASVRPPVLCKAGVTLICPAAISVCHGACSRTVSVICNACSIHPSCVGCSVVACSGKACSVHACSVNACSVRVCTGDVCSIRVCSANVCTDVACSLAVCSFNVCSGGGSIGCLIPNSQGCEDFSCGDTFDTIDTIDEGGDPEEPARRSANLAALKAQLKQQLAAIEEREKATNESLKPQTVAEVDDLQKKLQAAMEELKARRTELEQADKSKDKPKAK
jgi:hypothetical protein